MSTLCHNTSDGKKYEKLCLINLNEGNLIKLKTCSLDNIIRPLFIHLCSHFRCIVMCNERKYDIFSCSTVGLIKPRKIQNNVFEPKKTLDQQKLHFELWIIFRFVICCSASLGKCSYLMLSLSEETNGCVATLGRFFKRRVAMV